MLNPARNVENSRTAQVAASFTALRGAALSFKADPFRVGDEAATRYESDALVLMQGGKVTEFGNFDSLKDRIPSGVEVVHYRDSLILPGFIDIHVHYPQTQIIGAYGKQLIDWLNRYTFVAEQQFSHEGHARDVARFFLGECLRVGTTTSLVYGTVHPVSVDVFFEEAERRNMRMIAGKVLMDRNAPDALMDTAVSGYDDSKKLLEKWHGRGRLSYAITPRFAPTSTPAQLEAAGALWKEFPGVYMQTHLSENQSEVEWVRDLFPERKNYLDVYDHYGLVGKRAVFGHGIHLGENEWQRCYDAGAAIAHCPTSNEFLGSGLFRFDIAKNNARPVRVGLATDLGAGTSFSQLQTMNEAYKIAQLSGFSLSAIQAYYLATRGAAEALYLEDKIGTIAPGFEADLVVLDLRSTPLIDFRMNHCTTLQESLFIQMMMGDDRATRAVYVAGELAYSRGESFG
ncbi:MAG: guanine deaminase [Cryobacterium sp.]|nr:guanine deaminase [Oligoflexia bacterium]